MAMGGCSRATPFITNKRSVMAALSSILAETDQVLIDKSCEQSAFRPELPWRSALYVVTPASPIIFNGDGVVSERLMRIRPKGLLL